MPARRPRGLSLVEILVALALGLLLVSAVATLLVSHIVEHRRLLAEVRLMQDLRAAADLVTRDLRRAGYWGRAEQAVVDGTSSPPPNPYAGVWPDAQAGTTTALGYSYSRDDTEDGQASSNERFGFRLNARTHVLEMRLGGAAITPDAGDSWQPLTDPNALLVTQFAVTSTQHSLSLLEHCPTPVCASGSTTCPPRLQVSVLSIEVGATDPRDRALTRVLRTQVRTRNDLVSGACPS
jgi:prepilin peptidase dependent protein B